MKRRWTTAVMLTRKRETKSKKQLPRLRRKEAYCPRKTIARQLPSHSTSHHVDRNVTDCGFGCGALRVKLEAHHKLSPSISLSQALNPAIPLESLSPSISKTETLLEAQSQNNGCPASHPHVKPTNANTPLKAEKHPSFRSAINPNFESPKNLLHFAIVLGMRSFRIIIRLYAR